MHRVKGRENSKIFQTINLILPYGLPMNQYSTTICFAICLNGFFNCVDKLLNGRVTICARTGFSSMYL